jgi:hypothetical protein
MRKGPGSVYDKWNISMDSDYPFGIFKLVFYKGQPDFSQ